MYLIEDDFEDTSTKMATPIQVNLINANKEYASKFKEGHLALPAKKYAVGRSIPPCISTKTTLPDPKPS